MVSNGDSDMQQEDDSSDVPDMVCCPSYFYKDSDTEDESNDKSVTDPDSLYEKVSKLS